MGYCYFKTRGIWSEGTGFALSICHTNKIREAQRCSVTMVNPNGSSRVFTKVIILRILSTSLPSSEPVRTINIAAPTPKPFTTNFNHIFPALLEKLSQRMLANGKTGRDLDVLRDRVGWNFPSGPRTYPLYHNSTDTPKQRQDVCCNNSWMYSSPLKGRVSSETYSVKLFRGIC